MIARRDLVQQYNELLSLREKVHALETKADSDANRSSVPPEH
jgi:hypothetical protein